jgi:hypothetical protein
MLASGVDDVISQLVSCAKAVPIGMQMQKTEASKNSFGASQRQYATDTIDVSSGHCSGLDEDASRRKFRTPRKKRLSVKIRGPRDTVNRYDKNITIDVVP